MIYPTPDPLRSEEDWLRSTHQDLDNMGKEELVRESKRVDWHLLFDDDPDEWLVQRRGRLRALIYNKNND